MQVSKSNGAQADAVKAAVAAVNTLLEDPPELIGESTDRSARFELYQAGISICSQKVRTVLLEKQIPFLVHELNPRPDAPLRHHFPEYVKMRLLGALPHHELTGGFSGATAVATDGLEPTVVPTLVDHEQGRVVLDSKVICNYIDEAYPNQHGLTPPGREAEIEALVDIVDRTPHPSLLMGAESPLDRRPAWLKDMPIPDAQFKIQLVERYLEENRDDPVLVRAYVAKIAREKAAQDFYHRPGRMEETLTQVKEVLALTERALGKYESEFLLGDVFTMADIHTVLNLFRLQNMGWRELFGERTKAYADKHYLRPSIVAGMVAWPMTWFWAPDYFESEVLDLYQGPKP